MIDWNNLFKVRLSSITNSSMHKHDVIKLLLVRKLLEKHKKERAYIRIYTEIMLENGRKVDVYYENIRTKEAYAYEIQKVIDTKWSEEIKKAYGDWNVYGCKTSDLIIIDINKMGNSVQEINMQLDKFVL